MAHVIADVDTKATPERIIRALTDFSPRRFELWPNVDKNYYKVGTVGDTSADVTEGSPFLGGGVWERAHYDWSTPGTVRIDVQESNAFKPGSFWLYTITPGKDGGAHVHMEFDRRPRNLKGYVVGTLLSLFGKKIFTKSLADTVKRVEDAKA